MLFIALFVRWRSNCPCA